MVSSAKHAKATRHQSLSPSASPLATPRLAPTARCSGGVCPGGVKEPIARSLERIAALREHARRQQHDHDVTVRESSARKLQLLKSALGRGGEARGTTRASGGARSDVGVPLRQALGLPSTAPRLSDDCALVLIDCQVTYTRGPMRLHNVDAALTECRRLLQAARRAGATVVHVVHDAGAGSLYDVNGETGAIVDAVKPAQGEKIVVKNVPSSFHNTELQSYLASRGVRNLVLCGFMTHCCISSTARAAFNSQKFENVTVVASATATRSLPTAADEPVPAEEMQRATLAGIAELHANVALSADDVQ